MPSILVIQPDETDPPERLGEVLADYGFELEVVHSYLGDPVPTRAAHDAVVVLGGDMGADDDDEYPWLGDIKELLRDAVAHEVPVLGVCLGAQLMASALGGRVERGPDGMESGTVVVKRRHSADHDELFGRLDDEFRMMTMHRDAITKLPSDAVWLADADPYPHQAFRVGSCAWGVQFHPEISPDTYRYWAEIASDEEGGRQAVIDGIPEVVDHAPEVQADARALAVAFAEVVQQRLAAVDRAGRAQSAQGSAE